VIVFRLEGPDGRGPYHTLSETDKRKLRSLYTLTRLGSCHPSPQEDFGRNSYNGERFFAGEHKHLRYGFASMEQVRAWFPPECRRTLARYWKVRLYRLKLRANAHIFVGAKQVAFNPRDVEKREPCF